MVFILFLLFIGSMILIVNYSNKLESDQLEKQKKQEALKLQQEKRNREEKEAERLRNQLEETRKREAAEKRSKEIKERRKREEEARRIKEIEEARKREAAEKRRKEAEEKRKIEEAKLTEKKINWEEFKTILDSQSVTLYHFTDRSNIVSIRENGGLYSWKSCEKRGISVSRHGGDNTSKELDKRYGLEDYVRLSFTKNHPMMYVAQRDSRISDPVILKISSEVAYWNNTRFSNMNATKTGHSEGANIEDLKNIKFNVVRQKNHFNLTDDEKPYYQAEVMVKSFIPIRFIENIDNF